MTLKNTDPQLSVIVKQQTRGPHEEIKYRNLTITLYVLLRRSGQIN